MSTRYAGTYVDLFKDHQNTDAAVCTVQHDLQSLSIGKSYLLYPPAFGVSVGPPL